MVILKSVVVSWVASVFSVAVVAGVVDTQLPAISYVGFESPQLVHPGQPQPEPLTISGQLWIPAAPPGPAIVEAGVPAVVNPAPTSCHFSWRNWLGSSRSRLPRALRPRRLAGSNVEDSGSPGRVHICGVITNCVL